MPTNPKQPASKPRPIGALRMAVAPEIVRHGPAVFQFEPIAKCRTEIMGLAQDHGDEFTFHQDIKGPVDPDWDTAEKLEKIAKFAIATLRIDGELAGYFMIVLIPLAHYKTHWRCADDTFFISRKWRNHRRGWTSYKFIKFCVAAMEASGAEILTVTNKVQSEYSGMWKRLGFEPEEITYSKAIRKP